MESLCAVSNSITSCCSGFILQGGSSSSEANIVLDNKLLRDGLPCVLQGIEHMVNTYMGVCIVCLLITECLTSEAMCALAYYVQLLPEFSQGIYSSKVIKTVSENLSKCSTCFLFLKSWPITRKSASYLHVLASNDLIFFLLFHSAGWEPLIFLHLFLWQQIIGSQKEGLLLFILNNPGFSNFFCIHCENEGLLFNPWYHFLSLKSEKWNPVWKRWKGLEYLVSDISEFSNSLWHWFFFCFIANYS